MTKNSSFNVLLVVLGAISLSLLIVAVMKATETEAKRKHKQFVAEVGPEVAPIYDELQMLFWKAQSESKKNFSDGLPAIIQKRNELRRKLAQTNTATAISNSLKCLSDPQWVWGFNKRGVASCYPAVAEGGFLKPVPGWDPMYDMIHRYKK